MWVKELSIQNFRNFKGLQVNLKNNINVVYGDNANGKTNLIEAIYLCATGKSQRAGHDRELVSFGKTEAHLQATVLEGQDNSAQLKIDVHLFSEGKKKGIAVDHVPIKKLSQLFGLFLVVIFTPEDLRIVKAGPAERRTFMDIELCQLSGTYYHALHRYYKALRQRNNLLKSIYKDRSLADTLSVWDTPLCEYGSQIMQHRLNFVQDIGDIASRIHSNITGKKESLSLHYRPQVTSDYEERIKRSAERDILLGNTSVGIHKDDLAFVINGNDVRTYGSQGQQRTAALSVKLAEIELIKARTRSTPVLLLDDVLSELDESRQGFLFKHIGEIQTILTCTGVEDVLKRTSSDTCNIMKMVEGVIHE